MKILKRFIIVAVILIIVVILAGIFISITYEDTAIKYLKKYLDKHLITEITVDKINFSLLKNFPNASVEFKNILAKSTLNFSAKDFSGEKTDPLLIANSIFFEFKLLKLLSGKYILKNIHIKNGKLLALTDKSGKCNYNIWIQGDKKSSSSFYIDMQSLTFTDLEFEIINLKDSYSLTAVSNKISLSGNLSDSVNTLSAKGDLYIRDLIFKNEKIIENRAFAIESNLAYDNSNFSVSSGRIRTDNMVFNVSGDYVKANPPEINLVVSSSKTPVSKLLELFPDYLMTLRKDYLLYGYVNFKTTIAGNLSPADNPDITTDFEISGGAIINRNNKEKLPGIKLKGSFTNGENNNASTSLITIKEFSTSGRDSKLHGDLSILNFNSPFIRLHLNGNIILEDMHKLLNIDTIKYISGTINTAIDLQGKISGLSEIKWKDLAVLSKNCMLTIANAGFRFSGSSFDYRNINGEIIIDEKVKFNSVSFSIGENNFLVSGNFNNLFEFLFVDDRYLSFNADVISSSVDFESIISPGTGNDVDKENPGKLSPDNLYFNSNLSLDKFAYKKFTAANISGIIDYTPEVITLKTFRFNSFNGIINGDGSIIRQNDKFIVQCRTELESIDIKSLFYSFNNFGQSFILDENLAGDLAGRINFSVGWDNNYNLLKESINADCSINIKNGELIDFEPLKGLSKFIAVEELQRVEFKNLNNEILIRDKTVIIPEMDIYSSAFDISALGVHKFDNSYDYRITVSLSDLLFKKAKRKNQEISEFGIIEDDGMGKISIPLRFTGKDDQYKSSFDKKSALDALKQNISEEKKTIKKIIREEFSVTGRNGSSRKDSAGIRQVNITWEEQNNKKDVIFENRDIPKDNNPEFIIQWDDEDTVINTDD